MINQAQSQISDDARDVKTQVTTRTGTDPTPYRTVRYTYDEVDQLKTESASGGLANTSYSNAFDYDGMGNRTRLENVAGGNTRITSSTPNELNQLTALSASVNGAPAQTSGLLYDKAGNTSFIVNPDGSRTAFTYDDADRLTRIEKRSAADAPLSKSEFVYDFASRKAISREFTRTGGAWGVTDEKRRVFDGLDVVQERNAANEVTAQLVRDGNIGGILARSTQAGATFFGYDGGGNVTLLTDENGDDVGRYRYDAFGNTLEAVGSRAAENPYRFSTKEYDAASGLYDFGFRFYSASIGRWINRDPIAESGGVNLYAMVGNSPVNSVDAYGLHVTLEIDEKDPNKITLTVPITYKGDAATKELQEEWNKSIEKIWSGDFGKYHVTTRVMVCPSALNEVNVIEGAGRSYVVSLWQGFWYNGAYYGGSYDIRMPAHEVGHFMGLSDKYDKKTNLPLPGWENNLMASTTKGVVEEKNIAQIIKNKSYSPKPSKK